MMTHSDIDKNGANLGQPGRRVQAEFEINVTNPEQLVKINRALETEGVNVSMSSYEAKTIIVDLSETLRHNASAIQKMIENESGLEAVLKGLGNVRSSVAELAPPISRQLSPITKVRGVVRMSQLEEDQSTCFVDARIIFTNKDKPQDSQKDIYSLAIHEFGDLSGEHLESVGQPIVDIAKLSSEQLDSTGEISIGKTISNCNIESLIGKSIAFSKFLSDSKNPKSDILSAGILARASTIGSNKKQICTCSGKTLWEERAEKKQEYD